MKMLIALTVFLVPVAASAQTAEDAHVQHMGLLADKALNRQYQATMALMVQADQKRAADLAGGVSKPDGRPAYQATLIAAERGWLTYRDAHCTSVGLVFRGGVYEDEAEGKCVNELDRKRTAELKALHDNMKAWK